MNSYQNRMRPWAIFQYLPSGLNELRARFRKRSDADAYMSILRRGEGVFEVVFDHPKSPKSDEKKSEPMAAEH